MQQERKKGKTLTPMVNGIHLVEGGSAMVQTDGLPQPAVLNWKRQHSVQVELKETCEHGQSVSQSFSRMEHARGLGWFTGNKGRWTYHPAWSIG
jgi:hypothetical protein